MMRRRGPNLLGLGSLGLILAAVGLFFFELVSYSRERSLLPQGLTMAGVPVGGLSQNVAMERLLQTYSLPVEMLYDDQLILLSPASIGFRMDTEGMLALAELTRTGTDFWGGFWDFLWSRTGPQQTVPLRAEYSSSDLEAALRDIAARYDDVPTPALPVPGRSDYRPGKPGRTLDIPRALELVGPILMQPTNRRVELPVVSSQTLRAPLSTLGTQLRQILDVAGFNGLAVTYLRDLQTGEELHFAYLQNRDIPAEPDIAVSAASTAKIAIMVAYYRYFDEPLDSEAARLMDEMITLSGNDPADWLMQRLDAVNGPLRVTEIMQDLGLQSTFVAGYYYFGADLLRYYNTPGNQRTDINTRPDPYIQTTASEMGMLLSDIYACSRGGGALLAAFPGLIQPEECESMIDLLSRNKLGRLMEAGVPEGTRVAHKHGWPDSPFTYLADVGIVFTPGGNYVVSLYLWNEQEMFWEPTANLFADLCRAMYIYFNPPLE